MTNVSPANSPITTKAIRPADIRPASLPSQLEPAPRQARADAVSISDRAIGTPDTSDAPIRSELVNRIRDEIATGAYDAEITDERLDAILPGLLRDIREA